MWYRVHFLKAPRGHPYVARVEPHYSRVDWPTMTWACQIRSTACIYKYGFIGMQPHPFIYVPPIATLVLEQKYNSCDRDCTVCKAKNTYFVALYRKSLLTWEFSCLILITAPWVKIIITNAYWANVPGVMYTALSKITSFTALNNYPNREVLLEGSF